jgi:hypothetical protein
VCSHPSASTVAAVARGLFRYPFITCGPRTQGSRSYVATERITGHTDGGSQGSMTVQHGGLESDPGTWFGHIVPGTGIGCFGEWSGTARIRHDDQGAYFEIELA